MPEIPDFKMCTKCKVVQPREEFNLDSSRKDGLRCWCKSCQKIWKAKYYQDNRDELVAYTARWVAENPEQKRQTDAIYRATHQEELAAYFKQRYWDHREELLDKAWMGHLRRRYNLTPERYLELLELQDSRCAICRQLPTNGKRLGVDHDHACCPGPNSCGECIRGLLCFPCNTGIGHFQDDPGYLVAAAAYLDAWINDD